MSKNELSRRKFIGKTAAGIAGVSVLANSSSLSAASYNRIIGSNDRINIGFLGCGARSSGHQEMVKTSENEKNLGVVAVCDIWKLNREKAAGNCKKLFGTEVKQFKYSEEMLKMPGLDAVMIATGDFQHAKILAEVVRAGKDCYCEKPMAIDVDDAKLARKAVLESKQVAQMGSQWVSDPVQLKVREIIRSGKLGQITKIEQVWNDNNPRWHVPDDPDVAAIREADTDWNRWLLGKPYVPFDPWKYFEFRIFRDYSGGITSQWMSHGAGLVHFYTDTAIPDTMVANGGIFGWPDIRQNPDTFQALATYEDSKMLYSYTSNYASMFGDYTCIRGKLGTLFAHGGEGSSRWFYIPEHQDLPGGFDFYEGMKETVKSGKAEIVTTAEYNMKLGPVNVSDNSKYHLDNWIDCMRARDLMPNGNIHTGFWHSVASIMATRAYREGKKLYWDRTREEIVEHPVT
jgi:predicted dehydrogenase